MTSAWTDHAHKSRRRRPRSTFESNQSRVPGEREARAKQFNACRPTTKRRTCATYAVADASDRREWRPRGPGRGADGRRVVEVHEHAAASVPVEKVCATRVDGRESIGTCVCINDVCAVVQENRKVEPKDLARTRTRARANHSQVLVPKPEAEPDLEQD